MVKSIIVCVLFLVFIVAIGAALIYLKQKYAVWREYKGTVVSISNYVMIIDTIDPGEYAVIIVEDEEGHVESYTTNLTSTMAQLTIGKKYTFVTCDGVLVNVTEAE